MATRARVLLTGLDQDTLRRFVGPLQARGLETHHAPWTDDLPDLVLDQRFDAVVVRFPVLDVPLGRFLSALRSAASPCRHAGVVLLARSDRLEQARQLIGHGVNRVVAGDAPREALAQTVGELMAVAPRIPLQASARITAKVPERPGTALCQTVNLSFTGMLVRGHSHYPVGALVEFELLLPGEEHPLHGAGEVARYAEPAREGVHGFATRFLAFDGSDRDRLELFLEGRLN
jgi:hypothetical protein